MKFEWSEFCRLVRGIPEVASCEDKDLHTMLALPNPPSRHTDGVGRPLPGSSLINEHPDVAGYRRVMSNRHRGCVEDGDDAGVSYHGRLVRFLESHPEASRLVIVALSTPNECYEVLYFADAKAAIFSPVRYLEGRKMGST